MMERLPSWYRWFLIGGAALIMSACRGPLHTTSTPTNLLLGNGSLLPLPETRDRPGDADDETLAPLIAAVGTDPAPVVHRDNYNPQPTNQATVARLAHAQQAISGKNVDHADQTPGGAELAPLVTAPRGAIASTKDLGGSLSEIRAPLATLAPIVKAAGDEPDEQSIGEPAQHSGIVQAGLFCRQTANCWNGSATACPPDSARGSLGTGNCPPAQTAPTAPPLTAAQLLQLYADEYLCDGGDAAGNVFVTADWSLRNLDPEDTIGHYDTVDGRVIVNPSNRVCIYAPRFAATRQVKAPQASETSEQVRSAEAPLLALTEDIPQGPDQFSQNLSVLAQRVQQPALAFRRRLPGLEASRAQALIVAKAELPPLEDLRVIRLGIHKQSERPLLAEYTARAICWSHDTAVQVILDEIPAQTRVTVKGVEEFFSTEPGPPRFRVIKTASVADALPGEEVEFTLRFDNVGLQTLGNVTIVDNLTTRLEYVPDSQSCSIDAQFDSASNSANSLTLRWEITEPLPPGKGGIIRFRCRVR